jgi:hypothetical protein
MLAYNAGESGYPAAPGAAGSGGIVEGIPMVLTGPLSVDVHSLALSGGDPCADPMTNIPLEPYLLAMPADATLFTVDTGGAPQTGIPRDGTFQYDGIACDGLGQQVFTITIEDGTHVGLFFNAFVLIGDTLNLYCAGCGP